MKSKGSTSNVEKTTKSYITISEFPDQDEDSLSESSCKPVLKDARLRKSVEDHRLPAPLKSTSPQPKYKSIYERELNKYTPTTS